MWDIQSINKYIASAQIFPYWPQQYHKLLTHLRRCNMLCILRFYVVVVTILENMKRLPLVNNYYYLLTLFYSMDLMDASLLRLFTVWIGVEIDVWELLLFRFHSHLFYPCCFTVSDVVAFMPTNRCMRTVLISQFYCFSFRTIKRRLWSSASSFRYVGLSIFCGWLRCSSCFTKSIPTVTRRKACLTSVCRAFRRNRRTLFNQGAKYRGYSYKICTDMLVLRFNISFAKNEQLLFQHWCDLSF
jgi:hypothetical protein